MKSTAQRTIPAEATSTSAQQQTIPAEATSASAQQRTIPAETASASAQQRTTPTETASASAQQRTIPAEATSASAQQQTIPAEATSASAQQRTIPAGKYAGILLCTDFDGTFAEHAKVSAEDLAAVRRFQAEGGLFTIASGRTPEFLWTMREEFAPNAPVVCMNGTMIADERDMRVLRRYPLDGEALAALCALAEQTDTEALIVYNDHGDGHEWRREAGRSVAQAFADAERPWYKALLVQREERTAGVLQAARRLFGALYEFERSWPMGIEMHQRGTGKGECVSELRAMLGDRVRLTIGVGDYENDISLLRLCDIGYAVANATEETKRAADRLTVRNTENAIARVIEELARL